MLPRQRVPSMPRARRKRSKSPSSSEVLLLTAELSKPKQLEKGDCRWHDRLVSERDEDLRRRGIWRRRLCC